MRHHRKKVKKRFHLPEVSLTPLIDTALTLLIIFLVTAPMVQNGVKIDLPQGKTKEVDNEQEYVISMAKDGTLYFNSFPVKNSELLSLILKSLEKNPDSPVYLRADEAVSYGSIINIVDQLKYAGVKNVALTTKPTT